ncbi:hypothetical protein [Neptuniibacter marinus]|uniref:hypothetical protein n=1 Tax=Neptuniibacter marinus TaxID=1806670 RepID=UPI000834A6DC|nr:hypothetical protein [Neptuniibacter marinus]
MQYDIELLVFDDLDEYIDILYVYPRSDCRYQKSLACMAQYFRREFKYDFPGYHISDHPDDCVGVLFCERAMDLVEELDHYPNRVIGGACFWGGLDDGYTLDWIWLHPFARNRGNLKSRWSELKQRFGKFGISPPVSYSFENFLKKYA